MKHRHIAIVEDDDNIRELLAENLKHAGYHVSAFFTAEQFERKKDADYDMLLLDIMLPGKSGLSLLKEIRASGRTFMRQGMRSTSMSSARCTATRSSSRCASNSACAASPSAHAATSA